MSKITLRVTNNWAVWLSILVCVAGIGILAYQIAPDNEWYKYEVTGFSGVNFKEKMGDALDGDYTDDLNELYKTCYAFYIVALVAFIVMGVQYLFIAFIHQSIIPHKYIKIELVLVAFVALLSYAFAFLYFLKHPKSDPLFSPPCETDFKGNNQFCTWGPDDVWFVGIGGIIVALVQVGLSFAYKDSHSGYISF